jgi:Family of unknown function (DUF6459)
MGSASSVPQRPEGGRPTFRFSGADGPGRARLRIVSRVDAGGTAGATAPSAGLPDPRLWAARLAQVVAEVLAGARSPSQLAGIVTLDVIRQLERGAGRFGATPGRRPTHPIVGSVHVCPVGADVAEACAVIITGPRVRALALRLEATTTCWRCTAVQIG